MYTLFTGGREEEGDRYNFPQPAGSRHRLSQQRGTRGDSKLVIIEVIVQTKSDQTKTVNRIFRKLHNVQLKVFLES